MFDAGVVGEKENEGGNGREEVEEEEGVSKWDVFCMEHVCQTDYLQMKKAVG